MAACTYILLILKYVIICIKVDPYYKVILAFNQRKNLGSLFLIYAIHRYTSRTKI